MATLGDVARRAGVPISSVSRALSNHPSARISEATRQRIVQAAQELRYRQPAVQPHGRGLDVKLYLPQLALATVIGMLPLMVVFLGAQRYLIRGETVDAVKG